MVTAERLAEYDGVSRYGVEEFAVDNVIVLRHTLQGEHRRRTIEIVKFRGAVHRTGEWLFTVDPAEGLVVIPLAFLKSRDRATEAKVSTGSPGLDRMCGGGVYRDAIVLLTGPTGAGKTLTALTFTAAGAAGGERCLIDHFLRLRRALVEFRPQRLVIDTLSALERIVTPRGLLDFVLAVVNPCEVSPRSWPTTRPAGRTGSSPAPAWSSAAASCAASAAPGTARTQRHGPNSTTRPDLRRRIRP